MTGLGNCRSIGPIKLQPIHFAAPARGNLVTGTHSKIDLYSVTIAKVRLIRLSSIQYRRLQRLARAGGRTTAEMLGLVLRDGFEYCEWQIAQSLSADIQARRLGLTPHDVVMREARNLIRSRQRKRKLSTP